MPLATAVPLRAVASAAVSAAALVALLAAAGCRNGSGEDRPDERLRLVPRPSPSADDYRPPVPPSP